MDATTNRDLWLNETGETFEQFIASLREFRESLREIRDSSRQATLESDRKHEQWKKELAEKEAKWKKEAIAAEEERKKQAAAAEEERNRVAAELDAKLKKSQDELNEKMGDLYNRFGELAEHLVAPCIHERFNELGFHFDEILPGGTKIVEDGIIRAEIDLLLQNDDSIVAIEVKSRVKGKDIKGHIKRLKVLREHRRRKNDNRTIYGAVAGAIYGKNEKKLTIDSGLYVLQQSGDTMKLLIPDSFTPREW